MWDLSFQARDQTCIPCVRKWILNHWTTRKVPVFYSDSEEEVETWLGKRRKGSRETKITARTGKMKGVFVHECPLLQDDQKNMFC